MKKSNKLILGGACLLIGATLLTGCTASFCSTKDKTHMLYVFDYGVTAYHTEAEINEIKTNNPDAITYKVDGFNDVWGHVSFDNCESLKTIINDALAQNYIVPTLTYYQKLDRKSVV